MFDKVFDVVIDLGLTGFALYIGFYGSFVLFTQY